MRFSGSRNKRIHYQQLLAGLFRLSLKPSPTERCFQIYLKNPADKPFNQIKRNPRLQLVFPRAIRELADPLAAEKALTLYIVIFSCLVSCSYRPVNCSSFSG